MNIDRITDKILELGKLSLLFARVNRATFHEDGITQESDTDHTVMLGLCACAFAAEHSKNLDLGKIAQYSFIHDLVEAYAGDTNSLGIHLDMKKVKEENEHRAFLKIKEQFENDFPWIHKTLEEYESLSNDEAKYVKAFDKVLPKVTQILNKGAQFKASGRTKDALQEIHKKQLDEMSLSYAKDLKETLLLLDSVMKRAEDIYI